MQAQAAGGNHLTAFSSNQLLTSREACVFMNAASEPPLSAPSAGVSWWVLGISHLVAFAPFLYHLSFVVMYSPDMFPENTLFLYFVDHSTNIYGVTCTA